MATYSTLNTLVVAYASLYGLDLNSLAYAPSNPVDGWSGEGGGSLGHSEADIGYDAAASTSTGVPVDGWIDSADSESGVGASLNILGHGSFYSALIASGSIQSPTITDLGGVPGTNATNDLNLASSAAGPITYTYTGLAPPGSNMIFTSDIDDSGEVVGWYSDSSGFGHGFLSNGSSYTIIDFPGNRDASQAFAINNTGQVVGSYADNAQSGYFNGFLYDGSSYITVDPLGSSVTQLYGINDAGEIVGYYEDSSDFFQTPHGFLYNDGSYTILNPPDSIYSRAFDINNAGEVIGSYTDNQYSYYGFLYSGSGYTTIDPPDAIFTFATSINDAGEVVGWYEGSDRLIHGFLYSGGGYTIIEVPGAVSTFVNDNNDAGEVVGSYHDSAGIEHGFIYNDGNYTTIHVPGSVSTEVTAINDAGEVTGIYDVSSGQVYGFIATPPCYCRGTMIQTERGEVAVEDLAIGGNIITLSGAVRPIKWIGRRSYSGRFTLGQTDILPICIKAGALDDGVPSRDLWVSPHHAMYLEGVLIEARHLVDGVTIVQAERVDQIEYFHIELDSHDVIVAEGAYSETYIDDDNRGMFHNAHEYGVLYGEEPKRQPRYCAARREEGFEVERARQAIARRAGLPCAVEAPAVGALHGFVDNIGPDLIRGWAQHGGNPEAPVCLDIVAGDRLIGQVVANRYRSDLASAGFGSGRHGFEFVPPIGQSFSPRSVTMRRSLDGAVLPPSGALAKQLNCGLRGYLDRVSHSRIEGWAEDEAQPGAPLSLLILDNDVLVARVLANRYRPDLEAAGIGNGRHGFQFDLPEPLSAPERHCIRVCREADGVDLERSPALLDLAAPDRVEYVSDAAQPTRAIPLAKFAEDTGKRTEAAAYRHFEDRSGWSRKSTSQLRAAAGREPALHVLVIDDRLPQPARDAGSVAVLSHIRSLQRLGFQVTFAAALELAKPAVDGSALEVAGVECVGTPDYHSMEEMLRRRAGDFDVVWLHRISNASKYTGLVRQHFPQARLVYSVADLHYLRLMRQAAAEDRPELIGVANRLRLLELTAACLADSVITHSAEEAKILQAQAGAGKVHTVRWSVSAKPTAVPFSQRRGIAFIGGYDHSPNLDAARWLIAEIMPLVRRHDPSIECLLVGGGLPDALLRCCGEGIVPVGRVENLGAIFDRVRLTVAPLTYGAGIKGKVVDSLAAGLPCVCTPVAAEGMDLSPSLQACIADGSEAIAETILCLHRDQGTDDEFGRSGLQYIKAVFSEQHVDATLREALGPDSYGLNDASAPSAAVSCA